MPTTAVTKEEVKELKRMVIRCVMLRGGLAAVLPLEMPRPATRTRLSAAASRREGKRVPHDHAERGDVPGWVMITLMSAVLVAALLALAGPALEAMFNQAMDKVGG